MGNYILLIIALLSLIGLGLVLGWKVYQNRKRNIDFSQFDDYSVIHLVIDYIAFKIVYFCKESLEKAMVFAIHFLRNSLSVLRYLSYKLERKFYQLTDSMKDKRSVLKTGAVSSFLQEIKDHQENVMAEVQNGAVELEEDIYLEVRE